MFTKQHRRTRNRQRRRQPINWRHVAAYAFLGLCGVTFFGLCLGVIYYGG